MKQHELDDIVQQANECHRKTVANKESWLVVEQDKEQSALRLIDALDCRSQTSILDTKEKILEHFGKPKPDFFGISDEHMQLLSLEGGRIQSKMLDNYLRLVFSFYPQKIDI